MPVLRVRELRHREVLLRVRVGARRYAEPTPSRGAEGRDCRVRRPRRLDSARREARSGGRPRDPRRPSTRVCGTSSSVMEEPSRSSSATPSSESSAHRSRTKTIPERAVRAALAIQEAIAEMNESDPALALEVRIGVNTGEALVALDARPELGEGIVSGDVVNTGARLQSAAPPGGILVGEYTFRATERAIEYEAEDAGCGEGEGRAARDLACGRATRQLRHRPLGRPLAPCRPRRRAGRPRRCPGSCANAARAAARHGRRRSRDRQVASRPRALPGGRCRPGVHRLEAGSLASVRRGIGLLGLRRDRESAGGDPRDRRSGGGGCEDRSGSSRPPRR